MLSIAYTTFKFWVRYLFFIFFVVLTGCSLPRPDGAVVQYDLGSDALQTAPVQGANDAPALVLESVQASVSLDSQAVSFRLLYADAQQPRAYAFARWSAPPAQLIEQRVRTQLGLRRAVLHPGEVTLVSQPDAKPDDATQASVGTPRLAKTPGLSLRLELEEFSQLFDAPTRSRAALQLRATLRQHHVQGESLLSQRRFFVQQPALTPDARGGVHALKMATDQCITDLQTWLSDYADTPH